MLTALINIDENKRVLADDCNKEDNMKYYCPVCLEELILRKGIKNIPHFSHKIDSDCIMSKEKESLNHELIKKNVYDLLNKHNKNININIENRHKCDRISDIGGFLYNNEIVIEVWDKGIDGNKFRDKLNTYEMNNIYSLHIFNYDNIKNPMIPNVIMQELIDKGYPVFCYNLNTNELVELRFGNHDGYRKRRWNSSYYIRPFKLCFNRFNYSLYFKIKFNKYVLNKPRPPLRCKILGKVPKKEDTYFLGTDNYIFIKENRFIEFYKLGDEIELDYKGNISEVFNDEVM